MLVRLPTRVVECNLKCIRQDFLDPLRETRAWRIDLECHAKICTLERRRLSLDLGERAPNVPKRAPCTQRHTANIGRSAGVRVHENNPFGLIRLTEVEGQDGSRVLGPRGRWHTLRAMEMIQTDIVSITRQCLGRKSINLTEVELPLACAYKPTVHQDVREDDVDGLGTKLRCEHAENLL